MIRTTIDGVEITADDRGNVSTMSDWTRCDDLADRGLLRRVNYGPSTYGHTDFFLVDEMAQSALEGWRVTVSPTGMVTRGDPRPQSVSPFVARALAGRLPAKELAR